MRMQDDDRDARPRPRRPTRPSVADDPRWARIVARDKTADGQLWYSVSTTGVYCRPSCPSRIANPENVQLHDSLESAKATGFRPCRRCNPDGPSIEAENAALVAKACRIIEESEEEPSLEELARAVGRSPSYFHRVFKATTGLTPKDYAAAHRAKKVRQGLASGNTVTEAIYDAGFNSSGRFYEKSTDMLGMTPSQYRAGGANEEIRFAVGQTSLGAILVASSKKGVAVDPARGRSGRARPQSPGSLSEGAPHRRRSRLRGPGRAGRRLRRDAGDRPGSSARRPRHGLPAARVAGAAGDSRRRDGVLRRNRPAHRMRRRRCAPSPARARRTNSRSPFPAIAWSATTVRSRAMPGASSASVPCSTGRRRKPHEHRRENNTLIARYGHKKAWGRQGYPRCDPRTVPRRSSEGARDQLHRSTCGRRFCGMGQARRRRRLAPLQYGRDIPSD